MELIFGGLALAKLLEASDAENARAAAQEVVEIAGGVVAFAGPSAPGTHAIGVGMDGPAAESDIDRIEEFYRRRGAPSNIDLCPLADPTLMERLGRRGYRITEFNNVLVRRIDPEMVQSLVPDSRVRRVNAGEIALWTRTLVAGFFERTELTLDELAIGDSLAAMHGAGAFLAEVDGRAAAAATVRVHQKLISLFGDSTLPEFRGKGLQPALIRARLLWAAEQECTLATAATLPGTVSQRNYQREGFQVAYTKMNMQREW